MGCLFEFIFELVGEILFELTCSGYIYLMTLVTRNAALPETRRKKVENIVKTFSVLLLLGVVIGLILVLIPECTSEVRAVGRWLLIVCLSFIGLQILAGILAKIVSALHKKK